MGRIAAIVGTVLVLLTFASVVEADEEACSASPKLAGQCFALRGRLFLANGATNIRIWRVGTKRILGILDSEGKSLEDFNDLPAGVRKLIPADPWDMNIYGDYMVCPFSRQRAGWMQDVCIAGATHLVSRPR